MCLFSVGYNLRVMKSGVACPLANRHNKSIRQSDLTLVLFVLFGSTDKSQIQRSGIDPGLPLQMLDPLPVRWLSKVHIV